MVSSPLRLYTLGYLTFSLVQFSGGRSVPITRIAGLKICATLFGERYRESPALMFAPPNGEGLFADPAAFSSLQEAWQAAYDGFSRLASKMRDYGAPRVVASLWQVDDLATAELMKHFYKLCSLTLLYLI